MRRRLHLVPNGEELARTRAKLALNHVRHAHALLDGIVVEADAEEKLAIAVKALRTIVSRRSEAGWAHGLAEAALKKIGVRA
jgi:hypothetical protein